MATRIVISLSPEFVDFMEGKIQVRQIIVVLVTCLCLLYIKYRFSSRKGILDFLHLLLYIEGGVLICRINFHNANYLEVPS